MMQVSYDYYRIFYYVGRYKSFSTAARMLGSNQPNVTKVMNKLEQQLGCTLFVRSNRGITLTSEGELLYERVKVAYEQLRRAEDELGRDAGLESGIVNIGASETALHGVLLDVLHTFHKQYPKVRIHLSNYSTPQAIQALKQGLVDFCVVTTPLDIPKKFRTTEIMKFTESLIASEDFVSQEKKSSFTITELADFPIVSLAEGTGTYEYYTKIFAEYGCQFSPNIQAATSDQLMPLIENNLGIGFVPEFMAEGWLQGKGLKRLCLKNKLPARAICLVESTDKNISIAVDTLKTAILKQNNVKKLYDKGHY